MTVAIAERILYCEQASAEWFAARCGCLTSSRIADAIAKLKRKEGESAARRNLRFEILCEQLTGDASQHYVSQWMEAGKEREPLALAEYELHFGIPIERVGFVYHPTIKLAGCSPDALAGSDGVVECKCPKVETHIGYLVADEIPPDYLPQMLWQLACCDDRQWNDFVSYCPNLPDQYQVFRKRLERTEQVNEVIRQMEVEAVQFLEEVEAMKQELKAKFA